MKVVKTIKEVRDFVNSQRKDGKTVGLVPTMGYLHEGHMSLIRKSVSLNDVTVVSVFVNPIQFGANEDLGSYPRDIERDTKICEECGADLIFNPEPEEMYGDNFYTSVNMKTLPEELCGITRPVHFSGVMTVVTKLFNIVKPDKAFFGQKDAQQLAIIKQMVKDLNMDLEIIGCPIVRESDGLAKSSRNTYLSEQERKSALVLSQAVKIGEQLFNAGERNAEKILDAMKAHINAEPLAKIDYVKAVDALTMQQVKEIDRPVLFAMAVYIGKTRLIDNFSIDGPETTHFDEV